MGNRAIILLLISSLALNACLLVYFQPPGDSGVIKMKQELRWLQERNDALEEQIQLNNQSLNSCNAQIDFYRKRIYELESEAGTCPTGIQGNATMQAPAVIQKIRVVDEGAFLRRIATEEGTMIEISVELIPGKGRVLVQTEPLMGVVFQDAANTAVFVAQEMTSTSLSASDTIFSITAEQEIPGIDGPSAGALMTLIMIAALENETPDTGVTVTGTIDESGNIGSIGGLMEKAQAAKDSGKDLLLIPGENDLLVIGNIKEQRVGDVVIIRESPEIVDTESYIEEKIGIDVEYVSTIEDVMEYAFI
ncbi:MAG: hypothetical protein JW705_00250 [Methanosarcinaceae archaeon]|nr:hypothetical protein [Methanosarcinaceae archaeon]